MYENYIRLAYPTLDENLDFLLAESIQAQTYNCMQHMCDQLVDEILQRTDKYERAPRKIRQTHCINFHYQIHKFCAALLGTAWAQWLRAARRAARAWHTYILAIMRSSHSTRHTAEWRTRRIPKSPALVALHDCPGSVCTAAH